MKYLDLLEQKVLLERLVIGLEEPVLIKGLGELSAKIDSGNGGYNVIHGTDFHQQGNELMFTTQDSQGNEKRLQSKVIDTIEVNMGGGNIESRPVIELDIKFAGEDYKKIPFSVSDRSTNTNPILISKGFVEKELEALIDVGAMNISHDKIDVVYGEAFEKTKKSFGDTISNGRETISNAKKGWNKITNLAKKDTWKNLGNNLAKSAHNAADSIVSKGLDVLNTPVSEIGKKIGKGAVAAGKAAGAAGASLGKGLWGGLKTLGKGLANADTFLKGGDNVSLLDPIKGTASIAKDVVGGVVGAVGALGGRAVLKKIGQFAKNISQNNQTISSDKKAIQERLVSTAIPQRLLKIEDADLDSTIIPNWKDIDLKKLPIIGVTSFMCNKGENSKPIISGLEQKRNQWKKVIEQAKLAIPEVKNNLAKKGNQAEEQEESLFEYLSILEDDLILEDAVQTLNAGQSGKNGQNISITPQEVEEVQTYFENLHNFSLWFISIKNNSEEINKKIQEVDEELKKVIEKLNPLEEEYKEHIKKNQALAFGQESMKAKKELEESKAKLENEKKELEEQLQTSSSTLSKSSIEDVKNVIQKSDSILSKFFSIGEVSPQSITPIIINLSNEIHKHGG